MQDAGGRQSRLRVVLAFLKRRHGSGPPRTEGRSGAAVVAIE